MKPSTQQIKDIEGYIEMLMNVFPNSSVEPVVKKEASYNTLTLS